MLPFTRDQFVAVFADYNLSVWPVQLIAYLVGLAMVLALLRPSRAGDRGLAAGLALMWAWTGIAYHGLFFAAINRAAPAFAALFIVQALMFALAAWRGDGLSFNMARGARGWLGWLLIAYAGVLYPLVGLAVGHEYRALPMFGIAPCPLTLFTFGVLLLASAPVPRRLLAIPFLWSLVGGSAAFLLGVPQDWPLLIGGLVVIPILWHRPHVAAEPRMA